MTATRSLTVGKLTYSELLATTPWIAQVPNYAAQADCEAWAHGHRGRCRALAMLRYFDLDGSMHKFCYHHLYAARMSLDHLSYPGEESDEAREVMRNRRWQRRVETAVQ